MEQTVVTHEIEQTYTPRIYVASLGDYVAGRLHGRWINADQGFDAIRDQINAMLAESPEPIAEEWAIHDYENFGSLQLSEYEDLAKVAEVAFLMTEHGLMFASLVAHFGGASNVDEARRYMEEGYRGTFDSLPDYAQETVEDCFGSELKKLPEFIRYHIDWEGIAHDMELSGDVFTIEEDGQVHVFDGHI